MKENHLIQLRQGFETAFVNQNISSNLAYKPQFISNNHKEGRKVISSIESELLVCESFAISVAFITMGGITPLLQTLKELEKKNIPGKILTTDYLMFSDPKALRKLAELKNIELKMFVTNGVEEGFHTKGYIFQKDEMYRIIVGSSNMTLSALTVNHEWNTKIVSTDEGEYAVHVLTEFDDLWNNTKSLPYEAFIEQYAEIYTKNKIIQKQKEIARQAEIPSIEIYKLQPNSMQVGFINNLKKIYDAGENKALLISATGAPVIIMTGKKSFKYKGLEPVFSILCTGCRVRVNVAMYHIRWRFVLIVWEVIKNQVLKTYPCRRTYAA